MAVAPAADCCWRYVADDRLPALYPDRLPTTEQQVGPVGIEHDGPLAD
jgi:hypothetical protein